MKKIWKCLERMIKPEFNTNAYIWWCGNNGCDCHQAVIEVGGINRLTNLWQIPTLKYVRLWKGTYLCEPTIEEYEKAKKELKKECKKRNIPFSNDGKSCSRESTEEEIVIWEEAMQEHEKEHKKRYS